MVQWEFERLGPMGGGVGYGRAMVGSLPQPDLLAREAIQNSVDSALKRQERTKPRVKFLIRELRGDRKKRFVELAGLESFARKAPVLRGVPVQNCMPFLNDPDTPLRTLCVEDEGTTGLTGSDDDPESDWFRFLLSHGDTEKSDNPAGHTGGSYGYGKTALSSASRLYAIIAYWRYRSEGQPLNKLMGAAYLEAFTHEGTRCTGRAFLGRKVRETADGPVTRPWWGDEADKIAEALSIDRREGDRLGTTVLVIDPVEEVTAPGIIRAVETWWWPRLFDGELDVVAVDEQEREWRPAPNGRPDLKPYIRCWSLLTNRDLTPSQGREHVKQFNRMGGAHPGSIALVAAEEEEPAGADTDQPEVFEVPRDRIALVRVPKMVVVYHDPGGRGTSSIAGAFLAHEDIDNVLKLSEPPAHDKWEPSCARLETPEDKELVRSLLNRIRREARSFRAELRPPEPSRVAVADELTRWLAQLFGPGSPSRPPPTHGASPISIQYSEGPDVQPEDGTGSRLVVSAKIRVAVADGTPPTRVRVIFRCPVQEEESDGGDDVPLSVEAPDGFLQEAGDLPTFVGSLEPGRPVHFGVRSQPYEADWSVRLEPEVEVIP
ncbi:MAG: hypothetical protein NZM33_16810 [Bryobacteraceae bacterium]|nr:hypothetical protein [Bryobacteraceae bacterium]